MKKFWCILFSGLLILSVSGCKKQNIIEDYSQNISSYNLDIEFDTTNKTTNVTENLDYINNSNTILKTLKFHLYPQCFKQGYTNLVVANTHLNQAYPNGMSYSKFEINRVQISNQDINFNYEGSCQDILSIDLINSLLPNENVNITIDFAFELPNCYHRFGYGENTINLANFYPIVCVLDEGEFNTNSYNSNGDPFYSDISNYFVKFTATSNFILASTGYVTDESTSSNLKTTYIEAKAVRDFAIVLSDKFNVKENSINDIKIKYYYFDDDMADYSIKTATDSISTFSSLFGDYPYSTFSVVQADFVYGGMEYPNLVMISASIDNQDDYNNVIIHETAHQWWYGIIGNDEFVYPWLDEALTEYSTILFYDYCEGYNFNHAQMVENCRENYSLFISVYEDVLGTIDTSMRQINEYDTEPEYTYCTYVKGVLMYESLYQLIGKKDFISSLKNYYQDNLFTNVQPETLINAFEKTTKKNLANFFDSWLKGKVVIK